MIVPSIDLMGGRAVQLRQGREHAIDGGDPFGWLERFALVGEVAVVDLDAALGQGDNRETIEALVGRARCRVGGGIRDLDSALRWLDAGATKVVLGTAATPELCARLPRERVVAAVDARDGRVVDRGWTRETGMDVVAQIEALRPYVGGFLVTQVEREGGLGGLDRAFIERVRAAAGGVPLTVAGGAREAREIAALDAIGIDVQVGMALYAGHLSLADVLAERLGGEGPWPTVVCDGSGRALGLVWSNRRSLATALDERRGVYWSRSRDALWRKGESSGATQRLLAVDLDCDRDALRFTVEQAGSGFCHRGTRSCWGERHDLGSLERTIRSRLAAACAGSGTSKLLADPELLRAKLAEEAVELGEADEPEAVVAESADLIYFALVALVRGGGTLDAVERELARRALRVGRRPMEAKP